MAERRQRVVATAPKLQTLWCEKGEHPWERPDVRGQRPRSCPDHDPRAHAKQRAARARYRADPQALRIAREASPQVLADVNLQREYDHHRVAHTIEALRRRLAAVADAELHQDEPNVGPFPLRQALIDLASLCMLWADELPRPTALPQHRTLDA